jgi:hypothetical protein
MVKKLALLKKIKSLDKKTYLFIVSAWSAISTYIPLHFHWSFETVVLIVTIGNLTIAYLGTESGNEPGPTT